MNNIQKTFLKKHENSIVFSIIFLLILLFNLYMPEIRSDDIVYINRLNSMGFLNSSIDHYKNWSSRLIIEFFLMLLSKHFLLWKLLNSTMMFLTVYILCKYIFQKTKANFFLLVFSVFCFIPLTIMGETGWLATTLNYHWPVTFGLVAFYPFYQTLNRKSINNAIYFCSVLVLIFAANQEQVNVCYFVLTLLVSIFLVLKGNYKIKLLPLSIISFFELIFSITAPGNSVRNLQEMNRWFPQNKNFSFLQKIDLGISSLFKPFFIDINPIFFLLLFFILFVSVLKTKNFYVRLCIAFPLFFNIVLFYGSIMKQGFSHVSGNFHSMIWKSNNLEKVFTKTGTGLSVHYLGSLIPTLLFILTLCCLIVGLYVSFEDKNKSLLSCILLLMGFSSRILMGFSPTVWASGMRTYYILFVVSAILILMLINELLKNIPTSKIDMVQLPIILLGLCTFILAVLNRGPL